MNYRILTLPKLYKQIDTNKNIRQILNSYNGKDWNKFFFSHPRNGNFNLYSIYTFRNDSELNLVIQSPNCYIPSFGEKYILPLENTLKVIGEDYTKFALQNKAVHLKDRNVVVNSSNDIAISLWYEI
jgi:hypothetical protein